MTHLLRRACFMLLLTGVSVHSVAAQPTLRVSASAQMSPMIRALADAFHGHHDDVTIDVTPENAGKAMAALRKGRVDFAAVSRPPTREELRLFHQVDHKQLIGTPIAMGAVALIVRPDNPLRSMSVQQARDVSLLRVFDWRKLNVIVDGSVIHEHSSTCRHPIKKGALINLSVPNDGRDTLEFMRMNSRAAQLFPFDFPRSERDEQIAHFVSFDANAIGLVTWASYENVRIVAIRYDDQDEGVLPTRDTIQSRAYPLSQYFYLYTIGQPTASAKAFLTFAMSEEGQGVISRVGGVPLPMHTNGDKP